MVNVSKPCTARKEWQIPLQEKGDSSFTTLWPDGSSSKLFVLSILFVHCEATEPQTMFVMFLDGLFSRSLRKFVDWIWMCI
jgi:hypothetical protein